MKRVWQFFVTNQTGDTQASAQITVLLNGSPATIYSDKTGTAKTNPFNAESNGLARFYADAGKYYTVQIQIGTETLVLPDVYLGFPEPDSDNKTYAIRNGEYVEIVTELNVTKESLGLASVDNTADIDKPISNATQQALNNKQGTITGAATTITSANLNTGKVLVSSSLGKVAVGDCDADRLAYLKTARSDLQAQIDAVALGNDVLFLGFFATQAALETEYPSPDAGSWAYIDAASTDIKRATWDATDNKYIVGGSVGSSDDITEGSTNLFYTAARQQAIADALALKVDKETGKGLSQENFTTAIKNRLANTSGTNTGDQDLSGYVLKDGSKVLSDNNYSNTEKTKVQNAYDGIKPHYTTNQDVTVANETEWLDELAKAVKATYASSNIKYTITLPSSINFQITLYYVNCPNLVIVIPDGATVDCTSFTNNYFGFVKAFIVQIDCVGVSIYGSASTTNGTGVAAILAGNSINSFYANIAGANLELSGFSVAPVINGLVGGNGVPKITGYSGSATFNNMQGGSAIVSGDFSKSGTGTVTLIGSNNVTISTEGSLVLSGSSYTGTATIFGSGILEKQSTVANFSIQSGSSFSQIKINSNNWNELSYTDIQALTPTNGLEFYDTTWKVRVRGNGTNWVPQSPFRVHSSETNDVSSSSSEVALRSFNIPFKYIGDKGRLLIHYCSSFAGTNTNINNMRMYISSSSSFSGATKVFERPSSTGLNFTASRQLNSTTHTAHHTAVLSAVGIDGTSSSVVYSYDSAQMNYVIITAQCSGIGSDAITLKSTFIDIIPSFS